MRTLDEALNAFAYHPATPDTAPKHQRCREIISETAGKLWALVPDGPEKTMAMRRLSEALMYANLGIALQAPVDDESPEVARVLPGFWRCSTCNTDQASSNAKIHCCPAHTGGGPICAICANSFHPMQSTQSPG